jgi:hypothetical protein
LLYFLGGTPPKPPWVGFAELWVNQLTFCEAEQKLFASFSGKRRILLLDCCILGGTPFKVGWLRRALGQQPFCEAEQRLFASFSGKRRI